MTTLFQLPGEPLSNLLTWICGQLEGPFNIVSLAQGRKRNLLAKETGRWDLPLVRKGSVSWGELWDMAPVLLGEADTQPWLGTPGKDRDAVRGALEAQLQGLEALRRVLAHHRLEGRASDPWDAWLPAAPSVKGAKSYLTWRLHPKAYERARAQLEALEVPRVDSQKAVAAFLHEQLVQARDQIFKKG